MIWLVGGGGGTPYNGLYGVPFSAFRYMKGVGISSVEVYERLEISVV